MIGHMTSDQAGLTDRSRSLLSSSATGLRENLSLGDPSGLPRWLISTTLHPLSRTYLMLGKAATILRRVNN